MKRSSVVWLVVGLVVALVVTVGVAASVAFVLIGGDDDGSDESREETTERAERGDERGPTGESPSPELEPFYTQSLSWDECDEAAEDGRGDFECTWLEVPLDYDEPDGDTIDLRVLRRAADGPQDERVGSLLVNPGGPGSGGTELAAREDAYGDALLESFDIVGWDPRGTGQSSPIDCLSDADLDDYLAASGDPNTPEGVALAEEWQQRLGDGCEDLSPDLVDHISTVETAKDMDVLRAVLGDDQMHYLGFSYGTTLGAVYATYFPERSERLVLDGATDPNLDRVEGSLSQTAGFELAFRNYLQACVDDGDCPVGDSVDEGLETVQGLLDSLLEEPLPTSDPDRVLTQALGTTGIQAALYNEQNWPYLTDGLEEALDGTGDTLLLLADFYADRDFSGGYASNLMEAFYAISCLDDPTSLSPEQAAQYADDFDEAAPTFGDGGELGLGWCSAYPGRQAEEPREVTGAGAAPIVVIGTTGDPATPYEEAVAMAETLESGVLVTREGEGHTAYGSGNDCIDGAVEAFLVDGEVPEDGLTCS